MCIRDSTKAENDAGIAALFMGFFGITEGAIPLAAARPLQVIPANVAGGAVAGALAGLFGAQDHVMHGGPIVAVLGAVDNVVGFFIAMLAGIAVCAGLILLLVGLTQRKDKPLVAVDTISLDKDLGSSSEEVIRSMVKLTSSRMSDMEAVAGAALKRESTRSTGVGHGVAIPHARSAGVKVPTLAFARLPEAVSYTHLRAHETS